VTLIATPVFQFLSQRLKQQLKSRPQHLCRLAQVRFISGPRRRSHVRIVLGRPKTSKSKASKTRLAGPQHTRKAIHVFSFRLNDWGANLVYPRSWPAGREEIFAFFHTFGAFLPLFLVGMGYI
jgi:hypothetical protein